MIKLALTAALSLIATAAMATTVTSTYGPDTLPLPAGQHIVFSFDAAPTGGFVTGTGTVVNGSLAGQYVAPYLDTTDYQSVAANRTTTLHLTTPTKALSLYWGSIAAYNEIAFFDSMGTLVSGYFGDAIPLPPSVGPLGIRTDSRRVNFDFGANTVQFITFNSSENSFEFDDVAVSGVPEASTWSMLIAGFGLVGFSARRRRSEIAC